MTTCVLANHLIGKVLAAKIVRKISKSQFKSAWKNTGKITTPSTSVAIEVCIRINCTKASIYVYPFISRNGLLVVEKILGLRERLRK